MKRDEFEHVIRAACAIVEDEIVVIGSQAVLAQHPDAPETLLVSAEVDLFPRLNPDRSAEIDWAMGDGSRFHQTYAYYAHGVGPETVVGPAGWEDRLVPLEVRTGPHEDRTVTAWCLEVHDLILASSLPDADTTTNLSKRRSAEAWSISTDCVPASSLYPRAIASPSVSG